MGIILASASPRRAELLRQIGCNFTVITSDAQEDNERALPPPELAVFHAREKAQAVADGGASEDVVIGADTIVVLSGKVFGKPRDSSDAKRMLGELAGREHQVITGIAVVANNVVYCDHEATSVRLRNLSDQAIADYVATGEPMDKAGAYAIQGIGALLVEGITGCYSNVVGLPLVALDKLLCQATGAGLR